jgi:hypothetical protein
MLIGLSQALRSYWWLGVIAAVAVILLLRRLIKSPEGQLLIDRFKMTAPFLGDLSRRVAAVFFAKTLGTLLANGVPIVTSLRVVIASVNNRYLARSLAGVQANVENNFRVCSKSRHVSGTFTIDGHWRRDRHLADMLLSATLENDARAAVRRLPPLGGFDPGDLLVVAFIGVSLCYPYHL